MRIGEVCLLTDDVARLAGFYRQMLELESAGEEDATHQTLLARETMLTVLRDDAAAQAKGQRIALAFTVADVDRAHERLLARNVVILEPPTTRPWGSRNLCLRDPDGNRVYLRSFPASPADEEPGGGQAD